MKKKKKSKKSTKKPQEYSLLLYVEENTSKLKKFSSNKEMGIFIDDFYKKHPDYLSPESDSWVDFAVTGIYGEIYHFTDGIEVE